jgi:hypothetical protein
LAGIFSTSWQACTDLVCGDLVAVGGIAGGCVDELHLRHHERFHIAAAF